MRRPTDSMLHPPAGTKGTRSTSAHKRFRTFKTVQFIKKAATTVAGGLAIGTATFQSAAPADGVFDGKSHDRWPIKTSVETSGALSIPKTIKITDLANLPKLQDFKGDHSGTRFTEAPMQGFQEGQIVETDGYIHLAVVEADSDYHIQMNANPTNDPSELSPCVIVEVPHPDATSDADLSATFAKIRNFVRVNCFGGAAPSGAVTPPVHVHVVGQLFFDQWHAIHPGPRGKPVSGSPMPATTIWEIHPITEMTLSQPPP